MTAKEKLKEIQQAEKKWDTCLVIAMGICTVMGLIGLPYLKPASGWEEWILFGAIGFVFAGLLASSFVSLLDRFVRAKWLKSYFIEDCGDAVKLHGPVRGDLMIEAYRDLLSTRPGLIMVDEAYALYGCTFAAVNASEQEKSSRKELRKHGVEISSMSKR
jgi:hypothetical protein